MRSGCSFCFWLSIRAGRARAPADYALFGVLFAASILVKPVAIFLVPFFPAPLGSTNPDRRYVINNGCAAAAATALLLAALGLFNLSGYSIPAMLGRILNYSNQGGMTESSIIFGLPLAYPFSEMPFLRSRRWLLIVMICLFFLYNRHRLNDFDAVLVAFGVWFGLSGLAPQYFIWPVPFILLAPASVSPQATMSS